MCVTFFRDKWKQMETHVCHMHIFKDATLFFSHSTPNLATVIPAMDHIDETLTNQSQDASFEPSIHAAISIAKKTLNNYYDKTDHTEVYRIAMGNFHCIVPKSKLMCMLVLHPHHKLKYFKKAGWEPDWITAVEEIVCAEFERSYAPSSGKADNDNDSALPKVHSNGKKVR